MISLICGILKTKQRHNHNLTGTMIDTENKLVVVREDREMEKAMAPHSSTLAWKIPRTEEPGRLQTMGSRRVGHD